MQSKRVTFFLTFALIFLSSLTCHAAYTYSFPTARVSTDADLWEINDPNNTWVETESGLSTSQVGTGWSQVYYDAFSTGFAARVNIDSVDCPTFCMVRIDRDIGTLNGNKLRAEIRIQAGEGNRNISYRLREIDMETGTMLSEISRGYIGDKNGTTWDTGETLFIGAVFQGNEVLFYSDTSPQFAKIELLNMIQALPNALPWRVFIHSETDNDSISATILDAVNVNVIRP